MNNGSDYFEMRIRLGSQFDDLIKGSVIFRTAIRITGRIFFYSTDEYFLCAKNFSPAYSNGKYMSVAEWDIGCWNLRAMQISLLNFYRLIRQARSADLFEVLNIYNKPSASIIKVRDVMECAKLPLLGALAIIKVKECQFIILMSDCRGNAAIHSSAEENDSEIRFGVWGLGFHDSGADVKLLLSRGSRYICALATETEH